MAARMTLIAITGVVGLATLLRTVLVLRGRDLPGRSYVNYTFFFLLSILFAEFDQFALSLVTLGIISFFALREYFSLIDIRPQDRIAIWGAFLLIPFQYWFVWDEWYGMFIIAVPVYGFLLIPLFVAMGGRESRGTIFSVGAIDFGLFLYVFCIAHIGYLMLLHSIWQPVLLILIVAICDGVSVLVRKNRRVTFGLMVLIYVIPLPLTVGLAVALMPWTLIPLTHSIILGLLIPALTMLGRLTGRYIKHDLVGGEEPFIPVQGQVLDNLRSFFYAAPVTFHYIRYFLGE